MEGPPQRTEGGGFPSRCVNLFKVCIETSISEPRLLCVNSFFFLYLFIVHLQLFAMVTCKIEGSLVTLLNVYAPPGSDWSFFKRLFDLMASSQGTLICGGDLNIRLNPNLDSSGVSIQRYSTCKKINTIMKELGIIDIWRETYPSSRDYTHYSSPHSTYSRIDYFFLFSKDRYKVRDCDIGTIDLSDHAPIYLSVILDRIHRSTIWKLNSTILNNPQIVQKLKNDIEEYLVQNDKGDVSPSIIWDAMKAVMRGKVIEITSFNKKLRSQKLEQLQAELKRLQTTTYTTFQTKLKQEMNKLKHEINELYTLET
uniref:Endonuclease/exonuclease/phosphatase domain-containing protein n=1 Tax=Pygocentrus nattereri TaxID=42514 RepID=A0AAR2KHU4_PYGNA